MSKAVAEADEARGLACDAVDVEAAGQHQRLVGDDADRLALEPDEAGEDVAGEVLLDLEEIALVGELQDQLAHVVGLVGAVGDQRVEARLAAGRARRRTAARGGFSRLLERQEVEQPAHFEQRLDVVVEGGVGDRGDLGVGARRRPAPRR